jgi:hypothetical protein
MSPVTRQDRLASFKELSKFPGVKTGTEFADSLNTVRLLIDHPHSYRPWRVLGPSSIPGFFYLESSFRLDHHTDGYAFSTFHLCLHESEFTRIQ